MTIPELLSLSASELKIAFYRDVLGARPVPNLYKGLWALSVDGKNPIGGHVGKWYYSTEEECWLNPPPVSAETWLKAMDELPEDLMLACHSDFVSLIDEANGGTRQTALIKGSRSEALKRAVLMASIYLHQQNATA